MNLPVRLHEDLPLRLYEKCSIPTCQFDALFVCVNCSSYGPLCQGHQVEHEQFNLGTHTPGHSYQPLGKVVDDTRSTAKQIGDLWSQLSKKINDLRAVQQQLPADCELFAEIGLRPLMNALVVAREQIPHKTRAQFEHTRSLKLKRVEERKVFCLQLSQTVNVISSVCAAQLREAEKASIYVNVIKPRLKQLQELFPDYWNETLADTNSQLLTIGIDEQQLAKVKAVIANVGKHCPARRNPTTAHIDQRSCPATRSCFDIAQQSAPSTSGTKTQIVPSDRPSLNVGGSAPSTQSIDCHWDNGPKLDLPLPAQRPPVPRLVIKSKNDGWQAHRRPQSDNIANISKLQPDKLAWPAKAYAPVVAPMTTAKLGRPLVKCETPCQRAVPSAIVQQTDEIEIITIDDDHSIAIKCEDDAIPGSVEEEVRSEMDAEAYPMAVRQNKRKRKSTTSQQGDNRPGKQTQRDKNSVVIVQETTATISATGEQMSTHMSTVDRSRICLICQQGQSDDDTLYSCSGKDCVLFFHRSCHAPYILVYGPDWICSYCALKSPSAPPKTDRGISQRKLTQLCALLMDAYSNDIHKLYWKDPKDVLGNQYAIYVELIKPNRPIWLDLIRQRINVDVQDEFTETVDLKAYLDMFRTIYVNCKRMCWSDQEVTQYATEYEKAIKASIKKYFDCTNSEEL